jgi:hypothetical protein
MAIAKDRPAATWRNFAAWSAIGVVFYGLMVSGISLFLNGEGLVAILTSEVGALVGLGLLFSAASVGFSMRKADVNPRRLRNFLISNVAAIAVFLLVMWVLRTLTGAAARDAMGISEWAAAVLGAALIFFASLGGLALAGVHARADLIDDEDAADQMRERGRVMLYSYVWTAACGLLLIGLSLAGAGGLLASEPVPTLAGILVLLGAATALSIAVWRLMDELDRTLSQEAGNIAFYLILLLGGGWAMLAHLGFVAAAAPLDWLTMFTFIMFAAGFIAVGRRRLLTR